MTGFQRALRSIKLVSLLGLLLMPAMAKAQGWAIQGQASDLTGRPISLAKIRVCAYTASGAPCSPLASLWSDIPQTHSISNPYTTDQLGNYSFVVTSQQSYLVQVYNGASIAYSYLYTAGATNGGGAFPSPALVNQAVFVNPAGTGTTTYSNNTNCPLTGDVPYGGLYCNPFVFSDNGRGYGTYVPGNSSLTGVVVGLNATGAAGYNGEENRASIIEADDSALVTGGFKNVLESWSSGVGVGDFIPLNFQHWANPGVKYGSDQGVNLIANFGGQQQVSGSNRGYFMATVATGGSGSQTPTFTSVHGCTAPNQKCYPSPGSTHLDVQTALATGYLNAASVAFTGASLPNLNQLGTTGGLPFSAVWGYKTGANIAPATTPDAPVSVSVTLQGGAGTFAAGNEVCLLPYGSGPEGFWEESKITAVSGTSPTQTITFPAGENNANVAVFKGSCIFLSFDGDLALGTRTAYPSASIDGTNAVYVFPAYGQKQGEGQTLPVIGGEPETTAGSSDSNAGIHVYCGAKVTMVSQLSPLIENLGPNTCAWAPGDATEDPDYPSQNIVGNWTLVNQNNPSWNAGALQPMLIQGDGMGFANTASGMQIQNLNPLAWYNVGSLGGNLKPPSMTSNTGLWYDLFNDDYAPSAAIFNFTEHFAGQVNYALVNDPWGTFYLSNALFHIANAGLTVQNTVTGGAFIDSGISTSTSPLCPNGAGGAFTTTGCAVGLGTVTTVSVATANGFQGTVANATTTPAITINVDSAHVLPVNTGSTSLYLNQAGGYTSPPGSGLSGMTPGQVGIAGSASTITSSKPIAGSGGFLASGVNSTTAYDLTRYADTSGTTGDSGIATATGGCLPNCFGVAFPASSTPIPPAAGTAIFESDSSGNAAISENNVAASRPCTVANALCAPAAGSSSITTLGTITAGVWNATPIGLAYMAQLFVDNPQTGSTNPYPATTNDMLGCKTITVASGTFTINLLSTVPASGQCLQVINYGSGTITVSPNGHNLNGSSSSATIPPGSASAATGGYFHSDGGAYEGVWSGAAGVTSFTGDGAFFTNSASTGAVTATLGTAGAYQFWGNNTNSTATPGYHAIPAAAIPTLNQSTTGNAATATALASTPTLCSTGQAPTGVLASGNATGCASILTNPMTTLGDIIYGGASGAPTRLAGATANGLFLPTANVTSSTAVAPTWSNFVNLPLTTATTPGLAPFASIIGNAITSATGGSGTGTVTCVTATCTNVRGSYTVAGGTFATGTLLALVWPTTTTAFACSTTVVNDATGASIGYHSVATATGMNITSLTAATGLTIDIDYRCSP